ncbi:MAG TPA: type II toxin-antitoxin system prevent-host-death family antitoxin [Steroidobacteraceae bacterium]|nr:type II toxin-antitoxin system prevent-host-death family antitoxin [Steroidobacteraceae bacterium]
MTKTVSATDAKNNFGGLIEEVTALGRVEILRHGRVVAVVMSPAALRAALDEAGAGSPRPTWGATHMIAPERARAARILNDPAPFDEDSA